MTGGGPAPMQGLAASKLNNSREIAAFSNDCARIGVFREITTQEHSYCCANS